MKRLLLIFILALGFGLHSEPALGQRERLKNALQERREKRQAEQLVDDGAKLLKAGKKVFAMEKFRRALQLNPGNDQAHAYLAQIAWEEQRMEIAKTHVVAALKINPHNGRAHLIAGQILLQEGKNVAAFDHLRKASEKIADEPGKREAGKLLARLRENHPAWFAGLKSSAPAPSTKPPSTSATHTMVVTPPKTRTSGLRPNLAVFTFDETNPQQPAPGWGVTLAEMLTTALINAGSYRIIERQQLEKVLEEQALGQSGALDSETAVVVGKIMSLDAVVVGSISALTNVLEADARILNVETGEAIAATHARAASADDLRQIAEALAKEISNRAAAVPVRAEADTNMNSKR
jgi:tetratricopeptide (TPR) repeat protein